jgi:hypothetical protein
MSATAWQLAEQELVSVGVVYLAVSWSGTGIVGVEREAIGWQLAGGELVSVALAAMQELQAQKSRLAAA